jgi:hypothetical protein
MYFVQIAKTTSVLPKLLEPLGAEFGVTHGVRDVAMPEVLPDRGKFAGDIDNPFANTREQYATLLEARDRPHVLDGPSVTRSSRISTSIFRHSTMPMAWRKAAVRYNRMAG